MAYGVAEKRSYLWLKGEDFLIVLVGTIIVIIASASIILGPLTWKIVAWFMFFDAADTRLWHLARYGFTLFVLAVGTIALHRVLPNARLQFAQILPGALATTILWVVAASVLSFYFGKFGNYASTYGSLGGVIITLLFFYVSAIIFVFGGEVNAALLEMHHAKHPQSKTSPSPGTPDSRPAR
jgi:membrane protein